MVPAPEGLGQHEQWMRRCIELARLAAVDHNEVPIAAIIVKDGQVLAEAANDRERRQSALGHAELSVIAAASEQLHSWRLEGCTLYVTLEPCPMCAGAILQARISQVIYGAKDPKAGADGSVVDLLSGKGFNHSPQRVSGILQAECASLLSHFFKQKRQA